MKSIGGWFLIIVAALLPGPPTLCAQGFFGQPAKLKQAPERYQTPAWGEFDWSPTPVAETLLAGSDAYGMVMAVASNRFANADTRPFVRAMALAIADQLHPGVRPIRLADQQLRHRRDPEPVGTWSDRRTLSKSLWKAAWRVHTVDPATGLTLLDLAAGFDSGDDDAMVRYRVASGGSMEGRWLGAVRLPDGIDAPDIAGPEAASEAAALLAEISRAGDDRAPAKSTLAKAAVFQRPEASLQVAGAAGGLVRLVAKVVEYDAATLKERRNAMMRERNRKAKERGIEAQPYKAPKLEMDFKVGASNGNLATEIMDELAKARGDFVRNRPKTNFPSGLGVEFEIAGGEAPATRGALSAAAAILLESMARGIALSEQAGAIGQVGFGSTLQLGGAPLATILRAGEGNGVVVVPDAAASDAADIAALGDLELLMGVQLLACRDVDHALQLLSDANDAERDGAIQGYADIAQAALRTAPEALVRNPLVKARLSQVLEACPEHLSAATLLKAGAASPAPASLPGSARRLSEIETRVRGWVSGYIAGNAEVSDEDCASELDTIRKMRPRLHPEARSYANGIVDLIDDFRDALERGGTLTARRADTLKRSLDSLAVEVATLGLVQP